MSRRILLHWDDASNTRAGSWRSMLLPWTTKPPIMGGNADTWTIVAKKNTMALAGRSHCAFGLTRTLLTYNIWFNFEDQATFFIPGSTRPVPPTSMSGRSPAAASPAEKAAGCTSRPVCPTPGRRSATPRQQGTGRSRRAAASPTRTVTASGSSSGRTLAASRTWRPAAMPRSGTSRNCPYYRPPGAHPGTNLSLEARLEASGWNVATRDSKVRIVEDGRGSTDRSAP
jgi:hypothetical protein